MVDLESGFEHLQEQLQLEREQWGYQRQQYEMQLKQLMHERDEAIRHKTIEAADARRQVNAMKEYIRELPHRSAYGPSADMHNMASDFGDISFEDEWENEFSLLGNEIGNQDDALQSQATPKPIQSSVVAKSEPDFSWKTFYMCLAFGAVVVAAGGQLAKLTKGATDMALPPVSEEYQVDARNVLNAVKLSSPESAQQMIPTRSGLALPGPSSANPIDGSADLLHTSQDQMSDLDRFSATLATPSKTQQLQQVFSMTPATYNHVMDPLGEFDDDADADLPDSPMVRSTTSKLAQAYAAFNAQKTDHDRNGYSSRAHERSALNVPESVMNDFRIFVHESRHNQAHNQDQN